MFFFQNLVTFFYVNALFKCGILKVVHALLSQHYQQKVVDAQVDATCLHCFLCFCVWQEGKQAALAADFSVTQFKHLGRLLMVHGRNSYKRSAALSQFVIHRSLCISAMQVNQTHCH